MKTYVCPHCDFEWASRREAELCCICYICGQHTEYQPCEDCQVDRQCEICGDLYEGENPEKDMHYGVQGDGEEGMYHEYTMCHECWIERQPALTQLGDCAES